MLLGLMRGLGWSGREAAAGPAWLGRELEGSNHRDIGLLRVNCDMTASWHFVTKAEASRLSGCHKADEYLYGKLS